MTEERSVFFTARDIADALTAWAARNGITIPRGASLTLVRAADYQPATATLTWKAENAN
jgi:hypothetical protein